MAAEVARVIFLTLQVLLIGSNARFVLIQQSQTRDATTLIAALTAGVEEFNADVARSGSNVCMAAEDVLEQKGVVTKLSQTLILSESGIGVFDVIPTGTGEDPFVPFLRMTFDCDTQISTIDSDSYDRQIFIPDFFETSQVEFSLAFVYSELSALEVTFLGRWEIARVKTVDVEAVYTASNSDLTARVTSGEDIAMSSLLQQFEAQYLPQELATAAYNSLPFVQFSIEDLEIAYTLSSDPRQIRINGIPTVFGYNILHFDAVVVRATQLLTYMVVGFDLGEISVTNVIKTVSGYDLSRLVIFNQRARVAVTVSPATLSVTLSGGSLDGLAVRKGIAVIAEAGLPATCSTDLLCLVIQTLLGNPTLTLRAAVESASNLYVFAGLDELKIGPGFTVTNAGYEVSVGAKNQSVSIVGTMALPGTSVSVTAKFGASATKVTIGMSLNGCWYNAFGVDWLTICNILGSIGYTPGVAVTAFQIGGRVEFGKQSCSTPIVANGVLGVDGTDPQGNFYFFELENPTTLTTILDALCVGVNLPRALGDSGFPDGFLSSYSLFGQVANGIDIPAGFRLKGTFNILGLEGFADINIGLPQGIDIEVALPVINVGDGLLKMYESRSSKSTGPLLSADIDISPPNVDIAARGYVSVLGISVETTLRITDEQYEYTISGKVFSVISADLVITAAYGDITEASYQVKGTFQNDANEQIEDIIKETLDDAANEADKALSSAQEDVDDAREEVEEARRQVQSAEEEADDALDEFNKAEKELEDLRNERICNIRNCGTIKSCVPCKVGKKCCKKVLKKCVCWEPKIGTCCEEIPDAACESENAACRAAQETYEASLRVAEESVDATQKTLQQATDALDAANVAFDAAQASLTAAEATLEGVKIAYAAGLKASELIASFGLNGLIAIREITFDVSLEVAYGGRFSGSLRATILGENVNERVVINLYSITDTAKNIADKIDDDFSSLF